MLCDELNARMITIITLSVWINSLCRENTDSSNVKGFIKHPFQSLFDLAMSISISHRHLIVF